MDNFFNVDGYVVNPNNGHHVDISYTDEGQREVYEFAKEIMTRYKLTSVADIGCGSGYKLMKYLDGYEKRGYEVEPALSYLRTTYPDEIWLDTFDVKNSPLKIDINIDLVISADVIEHLVNPDLLLEFIKSFNSKYIIISTPCREILCNNERYKELYGASYNGPPKNYCHVREWTSEEFKNYLSKHFEILESHLGVEQIECQYHLLKLKS